jgi:phage shock protein A
MLDSYKKVEDNIESLKEKIAKLEEKKETIIKKK